MVAKSVNVTDIKEKSALYAETVRSRECEREGVPFQFQSGL